MKFRLKGEAFNTRQMITEFDSTNVTVSELKARVAEILHLEDEDIRLVELSMNGKQPLQLVDDSQSLADLGFVSGDTIYILGKFQSNQSAVMKCQEINVPSQLAKIDDPGKINPASPKGSKRLISECLPDEIPESYASTLSPGKLNSAFEALGVLINILMMETGFTPESPKQTLPSESWKFGPGTIKICYIPECTVVITEMGPVVLVHGAAQSVPTLSLKLKLRDYTPPIGKNLKQLSIDVKNAIAYPLLVSLLRGQSNCPANLMNLPVEICDQILRLLDFKTLVRLSVTCHHFQNLCNQPGLWKRLLNRDFGVQSGFSTSNWKTNYKIEFQRRKEMRTRASRINLTNDLPFGHPRHDSNRREPVPFSDIPGIVGGYSDIYPDLGGGPPQLPRRRYPFDDSLPRPFRRRFPDFPPL